MYQNSNADVAKVAYSLSKKHHLVDTKMDDWYL